MKKQYITIALATLAGVATIVPVFAQENEKDKTVNTNGMMRGRPEGMMTGKGEKGTGFQMMARPAVVGTVTSINGTTITVSGGAGFGGGMRKLTATSSVTTPAPVLYTVNASKTVVMKNNATSSVSAISVGDKVVVQGTTSGTSVIATSIRVGDMMQTGKETENGSHPDISLLDGNGQPIIGGTVTSVSGNSLTLTNKSNTTYTIDATNAKVNVKNVAGTVSSVSVGDMIVVQGTVNDTSIVATTINDSGKVATSDTNTKQNNGGMMNQNQTSTPSRGFFSNLFYRLFGF